MKKNLRHIPTGLAHNAAYIKRLISADDKRDEIATFNYAWLEKGKQIDTHSHPDGEEFYLFLEGNGEMLIGEDWTSVIKDDFITIPVNNKHSVRNTGNQNLVFITLRTISKK